MSEKLAPWATLAARLTLATNLVYYGLRNTTGMFHGPGLKGFTQMLEGLGVAGAHLAGPVFAFGGMLGGIALAVGFLFKTVCWSHIVVLGGAIWFVQRWSYGVHSQGCEYSIALIALSLLVIVHGPGPYAFRLEKQKQK